MEQIVSSNFKELTSGNFGSELTSSIARLSLDMLNIFFDKITFVGKYI